MPDLTRPLEGGEAVDISATNHTFTKPTRAIWVGTQGTLIVTLVDGTEVTFTGANGWMPVQAVSVTRTGTDAAAMVGCW